MGISPEQARINGRKGGRKKGQSAITAEAGKALLIKMYLENIIPINEALLKKAREGDMQAIKELHDRVYNKAAQPLTGPQGGNIVFEFIKYNDNQSNLPPQVPTP
jgi:hypothetical protein